MEQYSSSISRQVGSGARRQHGQLLFIVYAAILAPLYKVAGLLAVHRCTLTRRRGCSQCGDIQPAERAIATSVRLLLFSLSSAPHGNPRFATESLSHSGRASLAFDRCERRIASASSHIRRLSTTVIGIACNALKTQGRDSDKDRRRLRTHFPTEKQAMLQTIHFIVDSSSSNVHADSRFQ